MQHVERPEVHSVGGVQSCTPCRLLPQQHEEGWSRALGLGGGSRPTGVLVQRWVQQRGVRGAAPGDFFTILMDFEAKSTYHTTYRTSLESAHVQICADPSPRSAREARRRARRAGRASWVCGSAPKSSVAAPGYRVRAGARGLGLGLGFGLPEHRGVARREQACGRAFRPGRVRIEGLEVSGLVKC